MERRLLERLCASKTEDMENDGDREMFFVPEIDIGVLLATWTDLIGKGIRESGKEESLVVISGS